MLHGHWLNVAFECVCQSERLFAERLIAVLKLVAVNRAAGVDVRNPVRT